MAETKKYKFLSVNLKVENNDERWWNQAPYKFWRQFIINSAVSVVGMTCSHYVPDQHFWKWVCFSLFLGHLINRKNYK